MSCVRKQLPCSYSGLLWLLGVRRFIGSFFFGLGCVLSLDGCNDAMVARAVCVVVRDRFPAPLPSTASQHPSFTLCGGITLSRVSTHFQSCAVPLCVGNSGCSVLGLIFFFNVSQVMHAVTCAR